MTPITFDFGTFIEYVRDLGALGFALAAVWAFYRGDVISRKVYTELTKAITNQVVTKLLKELGATKEE